jgi:hypothetical protein
MSYYKKIFKNKIRVAGSKGEKPSFLMPPSSAFAKQGFQLYEALDLICEGPVAGLVDVDGKLLDGDRARKVFNSDSNTIGSSTNGIDKGIYFDEKQLRLQNNQASHSKYDVEYKDGSEFQSASKVFSRAKKVEKISSKIRGVYDMSAGGNRGARNGNGSRDVRNEGKPGRDFVNWQNYVPKERRAKPYDFINYDRNVDTINIGLQIDQLFDTKSMATAGENKAGTSRLGTNTKETVSLSVKVGKVTKSGVKTQSNAAFTTRAGKGVKTNKSNGTISVTGVITNPYSITLEGISLPTLSETDAYNFITVTKSQHETISNLVKREIGIGTLTYINSNTYLYPNSCYVATSIDSKYYPQVPSRTYRLKGKKILIPSNYTPIDADGTDRRFSSDGSTRGSGIYNGDWDGTFKLGWSDNPAWIYYDLLINTRYGIGNYLRDTDVIDKWTLYEMGQYCDAVTMNDGSAISTASGVGKFIGLDDGVGGLEPRFSCNIMIKDQASAFEALQDLARSFRAMSYFNNSCVSVKIDRPHFFEDFNRTTTDETFLGGTPTPKELKFPPHLIFNNSNVNGGIFSYADVDRNTKLTALEVSFLDKQDNFKTATEYVEDGEAIKAVGLNFKSIDGIGVTSRSQAHRLAKYALFESLNTTETVSFGAGTEALLIEPGDIIRVDDEMRSFAKNYGTVIGTSGETTYYNPDKTGEYNTFGSSDTGLGPKAIIVQPAINSTQFTDITGNIHVYNALGKSGIQEFYNNPSANNQLYKEIHNPSIISLKIKEGGSGTSFLRIDNDVENSGAYLVFVDGVHKFNSSAATGSQWFSEKDALIKYGYNYTVDVTGREPKYYRVIGVEEDTRNNGFNVSATIHHTGKFKFVEENIAFDLDQDTFSPDLKITDVVRPDAPVGIATGATQQQANNTLNLPLNITGTAAGVPQKYAIFLEEPNGNILNQEIFSSSSSSTTSITLSGEFALDQVGTYDLNVFSKNTTPSEALSTLAKSTGFTTTLSDFNLTATSKFFDYQNISLDTIFDNEYNPADNTGSGNISYPENDELVNAVFDMTFEDIFGRSGDVVTQDISGQRIDLVKMDGTKIGPIKTLTNEETVTIFNEDLNSGFGFTGDGRFRMAASINFEAQSFNIGSSPSSTSSISLEQTFSETPVIFTQEVHSGFHDNIHKKLGRISSTSSSFIVTGRSDIQQETNYTYIATLTGRKVFDGGANIIETNFVSKNNTTGFQAVEFSSTFPSEPRVIIQLQQQDPSQSKFCETTITGVSNTGFFFAAFQDNTIAAGGTGQYAYLATSPTNTGFNNQTGSDLPIECLNYATTGATDFDFDSHSVLNEFNGTSVSSMRFNHDQYAVLAQRSGNDDSLRDKFFNVHRFNNVNRVFQHLLTTGLDVGLRSRNPSGDTNHIFVNTGSGSATGFSLTGVGSGMVDNPNSFDGIYTGGADLYQNTTTSGLRIKTTGVNNTWILTDDDPANTYSHDKIAWSGGENVNHPLNVTDWSGGAGVISATIADSNTPLANATTTGFHSLQIDDLNIETGDFSMIAFARFNSNLNGKQYLLESHKNGTGIAWFQSGDGKNYVNLNGVDYLAVTGNAGASLNDGNVHLLQVVIDRDVALTGYLDGITNTTINTNIIEQSTGFTLASVGKGMPQNPGNFNGDYTGAGNLYQNITSSGLRVKTSGTNNTWILVDEDPANSYSIDAPIAWSGGENINHPANVSSWTGTLFFSGFTVANVGSGMVNNTGSFNGTYTGSANLYANTTTSGLRLKQTGANNTWVFSDDDPANTYFTGFTLSAVGSGMVDNPGSFNGTYTGGAELFVNTTTSGLRIKTTGANKTWILCDDDPANSYSHERIAWSGGENVNFPGNVTAWTGGSTVAQQTDSPRVSPLGNFSSLLSHNRIAWSGGENENFPWTLSNWTGGQTVGLVTTSAPGFTNILSGNYPGSSAPTFPNLFLETFDSQTGFKLLGNSELPGSGLTSGHIINYISLTSGLNKADYSSNPNNFVTNFSGSTATEFLVQTDSLDNLRDVSISNANVNITGSNIERSESIIDRTLTSNFQFFQIGVTGTL